MANKVTKTDYADAVFERRNEAFRVLYDTVIDVENAQEAQTYLILCQNLLRICKAEYTAIASFNTASQTLQLRTAMKDTDSLANDLSEQYLFHKIGEKVVELFKGAPIKICQDHKQCLAHFFPQAIVEEDQQKHGPCYRISFVRENELVAAGMVQMPPGQKLKQKDLVQNYLKLSSVVLQRINAAKELVASEQKHRLLFEHASDAILLVDSNVIVDCNNVACQMLACCKTDIVDKNISTYVAKEELNENKRFNLINQVTHNVLVDQRRYIDCKLIRGNGNQFEAEISLRKLKLDEQNITLVFIRDISRRKREEIEKLNTLNRTKRQQEAIIEFLDNDILLDKNDEQIVKYINEVVCKTLAAGRSGIWFLNDTKDWIKCVDIFSNKQNEHTNEKDLHITGCPQYLTAIKSGRPINATDVTTDPRMKELADYFAARNIKSSLDAAIYIKGKLAGMICVEQFGEQRMWKTDEIIFVTKMADFVSQTMMNSENSKAQKEIEKSQKTLQTLMNTVPFGVTVIDKNKIVRHVNQAGLDMMGYLDTEQVVGHVCYKTFCPANENNCPILDCGLKLDSSERILVDKDGKLVPILKSVRKINLENESLLLEVFVDITEQKKAKEELIEERNKFEVVNKKLKATQNNLVGASHKAGMAEVATEVLHNVGNVLNSINVSAELVTEKIQESEIKNLNVLANIIAENTTNLAGFFTEDAKGKHIPVYLVEVVKHICDEQEDMLQNLQELNQNVDHIKDIIQMQQLYAKSTGVEMYVSIEEIVEMAVQIAKSNRKIFKQIELHKQVAGIGEICTNKQKLLQVLVNIINNAVDAVAERARKLINIKAYRNDTEITIEIADTGIGIAKENLDKIFTHGFTSKKDGHGFGLHSGFLALKEMGGTLSVTSPGVDKGAMFKIEIPYKPAVTAEENIAAKKAKKL